MQSRMSVICLSCVQSILGGVDYDRGRMTLDGSLLREERQKETDQFGPLSEVWRYTQRIEMQNKRAIIIIIIIIIIILLLLLLLLLLL